MLSPPMWLLALGVWLNLSECMTFWGELQLCLLPPRKIIIIVRPERGEGGNLLQTPKNECHCGTLNIWGLARPLNDGPCSLLLDFNIDCCT